MVRSPSVQVEEKRRPNMSLVGMSRLKMGLHRAALHAKITVNEINYLKSHPSHFVWQERSYPFDFVRRGFCSPGDKRRERMSKDLMSGMSHFESIFLTMLRRLTREVCINCTFYLAFK